MRGGRGYPPTARRQPYTRCAMHRLTRPRLQAAGARVRAPTRCSPPPPSRSPSRSASSTTAASIPERYETMLARLDRLRRDRQGAGVRAPRPAPAVVALLPAPRPVAAGPRAGGGQRRSWSLVFVLAKPYADSLPRSVVDLRLHPRLRACSAAPGSRGASIAERPTRRLARRRDARGAGRRRRLRRADGRPRAAAEPEPRRPRDRLRRRRPAQARACATVGLKVLGTTDEIGAILDRHDARRGRDRDPLGARASLRGKVVAACRERDIPVRTLPTVFELLRGGVQLTRQLREVRVEDVLGRDPVVMELDRVGAYLEDKRRPGHRRRRLDRRRARRARSPACARGCWCCSTTPRTTCSRSTAR